MKEQKPIFVIISDLHFTEQTLVEAEHSIMSALQKASDLKVPLVVAGDTLDAKNNMKATCVNKLIGLFSYGRDILNVKMFVMVGNHDRINERYFNCMQHSLRFLMPYCTVVSTTYGIYEADSPDNVVFISYCPDNEVLNKILKNIPPRARGRIVMHQGYTKAKFGHYINDKSAVPHESIKDFKVISGHYHEGQTISLDGYNSWTYIGNPYTLNFGEANHPDKGFAIVYEDFSMQRIPLYGLRKHVVDHLVVDDPTQLHTLTSIDSEEEDLIWVKLHGKKSVLDKITLEDIHNSGLYKSKSIKLTREYADKKVPKQQFNILSIASPRELLYKYIEETFELNEIEAYKTICEECHENKKTKH